MKISVIMPAYNSEKTIRESMDSVLSQKGAELELIVVNDGSTDSTGEILAQYSDRVKVITIPNGGVANARNTALSQASGDYIMFVDSDDLLTEGCIEKIVEKLTESQADMLRFEYVIRTSDGRQMPPRQRFVTQEPVSKEEFREKIYPLFIGGITLNSLCTTVSKRSLFDRLSFRSDMKTAEDAYLLLDVYTRAQTIMVYPEPFYIYRMTAGSLTGKGLSVLRKYECNFKLSRKMAAMLREWGMSTPSWYLKVWLRPLKITLDKVRRNNDLKGRSR